MIELKTFHKLRQDFPVLSRMLIRHEGNIPLVYLDNAATTQKPESVIDSITEFYGGYNSNVHRALHQLGEESTIAYEDSRKKVKEFIGASSISEIIFTRGTTESINLVAASWGERFLQKGDVILLSEMEHHSNLIPWQMLCEKKGCELRFIPFDEQGRLLWDPVKNHWDERTRLVAVTHMSNVFGTINPIQDICRFAHEKGALVLIDGAQGAAHLPVNVRELDCDFYAFSGHKLCGPTGIGVLYGKEEILEQMPPYQGGGDMILSVWLDRAVWNELPYKFEAGTPNIAGVIGIGKAIEYLQEIGMENIARYEQTLTRAALKALAQVEGISLYGSSQTEDRGAVISFNLDDIHPHDVAQVLDRYGIAVRAGHHCAHPLMRKLGVPATVRASFYFYNTEEEILKLINGLEKVKEVFHG